METQTLREMAQTEIQQKRTKKPVETMTEEQFLKDLYLFMKKRDSPIERIPNLGFKQIDLFVMFKVVKDFGGYHQVTAQQLWKQVYNTLGGNPRSTSAATCTRRHYEKLLLPYECHLTGTLVNVLPHNQSKHFHYANYSKEHEDGQRPPKRKLLSMPLIQNPQTLQPDLRDTVFPLPPPYARYFHPGHAVLPPHVPLSSPVFTPHCPPAPDPWFVFPPSHLHPTDRVKEPLEQLRNLAEQYKTTSGLTSEPLNLSVKASRQETDSSPASSFTPPSSSKSPKFLNRPSPLYTGHHQQVVRDDGCETQNGEAGSGDAAYSHPAEASKPHVIGVDATAASSPSYSPAQGTDGGATAMPRKPDSPRTDLGVQEKDEREGSPEVKELSFSHALPSLPRENEGRMEIEIPLSVFNNWLRQCGSSATMLGAKQLNTLAPPRVELSEQRHLSGTDFLPTNLTFHTNPCHQSSCAEDLRLARKRLPSPSPGGHADVFHHNASQSHFTAYKPLSSSGIRKNAVSQDVYPLDTINKCKPLTFWDVYGKESQASPIPVNFDSSPRRVQQDFAASAPYDASLAPYVASAPYAASAPYGEDRFPEGKKGSDMAPSTVFMLNSSSTSLLHLTTEEVMKLKKIISSSS